MNNNMTIREMMTAARVLKKQGERFTLLGVGPMSKTLLTAALSLAKERDFPLMLIASRNQVDSDEFGHGYVCGWDQDRFVKDVEAAAAGGSYSLHRFFPISPVRLAILLRCSPRQAPTSPCCRTTVCTRICILTRRLCALPVRWEAVNTAKKLCGRWRKTVIVSF